MTAPEEFHENCNMCAAKKREEEAAAGLRCASCLESFDKQYPFQSDEDASLCMSCERAAKTPKFPRGGMYGTAGPQRRDSDGPASTESVSSAGGGVSG